MIGVFVTEVRIPMRPEVLFRKLSTVVVVLNSGYCRSRAGCGPAQHELAPEAR